MTMIYYNHFCNYISIYSFKKGKRKNKRRIWTKNMCNIQLL